MKTLFWIGFGIAVLGGGVAMQVDVNRSVQSVSTFITGGIDGVNKLNQSGPQYKYSPQTGFTEGDRQAQQQNNWFGTNRNSQPAGAQN